jgi:tetratricopeptide (TPR) repeat protein
MMKFMFRGLILTMVFLANIATANQLKDLSQAPISQAELKQLITATPLTSPVQFKLIPRAASSGLEKFAFEQYSLIAQKQPNNGNALLLQGLAAEKYWYHARKKSVNELPDGSPQEIAFLKKVGAYLARAVVLLPNSAVANEACGNYLWQFGNDNVGGMKLLKKAVALAPKNASAHAYLADMYSNPAPDLFSPAKAEAEFREAARLDPNYAFPRFGLARLYVDQKRYREAQMQLKAYAALLPSGSAQFANVQFIQQVIDAGLSGK